MIGSRQAEELLREWTDDERFTSRNARKPRCSGCNDSTQIARIVDHNTCTLFLSHLVNAC
jgi:hypothetical protein